MSRWPLHKALFWETAPFFRLLPAIIAGILYYTYAASTHTTTIAIITGGIFVASIITYITLAFLKNSSFITNTIRFVLLNLSLLSGIWLLCYNNDIQTNKNWFGNSIPQANGYSVRIISTPIEKNKTWKLDVSVLNAIRGSNAAPVSGKAFIYVYKEAGPLPYKKGDTLLIPAKWQPIRNSGNPFEFDYVAYCARNNIFYQQFIPAGDIVLYAHGAASDESLVEHTHDWCMQQLATYITDNASLGLIQSMLLGDEVNLDPHILQAYAQTGIVHIIAISGGNVAIFFFVVSYLLWWIRNKKYHWVRYIIAIPFIWFYVLMAGAPPSAIRAATMFSILGMGYALQKEHNSLNQLFATAAVLLCIEPMWLFSVGFQLSFLAVLSLILFYSPIYRLLTLRSTLLRRLWSIVVASAAAEILTAPLVIYYFHLFPSLFIIANVIAYLFMGIVLVLGMLVVLFSFIPIVAHSLGWLTTALVTVFNHIVNTLQQFNPASFSYLSISGIELILVYISVTGIIAFFLFKKKQAIWLGLSALTCFLFCCCVDEWRAVHQNKLVVYNMNHTTYIEWIRGKHFRVLCTDKSLTGTQKDYVLKPAHTGWHAWTEDSQSGLQTIALGTKKVLVLNEAPANTTRQFPVDYLVLNYSQSLNLQQLTEIFSPKLIILGSNYNKKEYTKLLAEAAAYHIPVHITGRDGAFVLDAF